MTALSDRHATVSPCLTAALLLAARELAQSLGLAQPSAAEIIERTGAGRTRAYELRDALLRRLPELQRPVGRPPAPPTPPLEAEVRAELSAQMLRYLTAHPGGISGAGPRKRYSDALRHFVLALRERHADVALPAFAEAVQVPPDTIAHWLRTPVPQPRAAAPEANTRPSPVIAHIETILDAWRNWSGSFTDFCTHVREHLRIDYGHTSIGRILNEHGVRRPRRRPGRSPDEKALRGQFETFFPGAQWVGDGSPIGVEIGGKRFVFNLELMLDADSGAFTGMDIREQEDGDAVVAAFDDGVQTTGEPPLALLLDNRPSNHTTEVEQALGDTLLIPSTRARPQNKAHVEGGFGLFRQQVPALVLRSPEPAEIAHDMLALVVQTWARTLNNKPRTDRDGRSRVHLYGLDAPSVEDISQAHAALRERLRRQHLAAHTRRARIDPMVRRALDDAFERLGLHDPDGNQRDAIAAYPPDAVFAAIATFEGKRKASTLPPGADGRYLLGIARNITAADEGMEIAEALWRVRLAAHDQVLVQLDAVRRRAKEDLAHDPFARLIDHIDRALLTDRRLDRFFWLHAAADLVSSQPASSHQHLFRAAARRIHATHRVPHRDRLAATRFLAAKTLAVA